MVNRTCPCRPDFWNPGSVIYFKYVLAAMCLCSVSLPRSTLGFSVFRDCVSISKSYSLVFLFVIFTFRGVCTSVGE